MQSKRGIIIRLATIALYVVAGMCLCGAEASAMRLCWPVNDWDMAYAGTEVTGTIGFQCYPGWGCPPDTYESVTVTSPGSTSETYPISCNGRCPESGSVVATFTVEDPCEGVEFEGYVYRPTPPDESYQAGWHDWPGPGPVWDGAPVFCKTGHGMRIHSTACLTTPCERYGAWYWDFWGASTGNCETGQASGWNLSGLWEQALDCAYDLSCSGGIGNGFSDCGWQAWKGYWASDPSQLYQDDIQPYCDFWPGFYQYCNHWYATPIICDSNLFFWVVKLALLPLHPDPIVIPVKAPDIAPEMGWTPNSYAGPGNLYGGDYDTIGVFPFWLPKPAKLTISPTGIIETHYRRHPLPEQSEPLPYTTLDENVGESNWPCAHGPGDPILPEIAHENSDPWAPRGPIDFGVRGVSPGIATLKLIVNNCEECSLTKQVVVIKADIESCVPENKEDGDNPGLIVFENNDDDNIITPGMPDKCDPETDGTGAPDDDDLVPVQLTIAPEVSDGVVTLSLDTGGWVRVYRNRNRSGLLLCTGRLSESWSISDPNRPTTVYVEGCYANGWHPCSSSLTLAYTVRGVTAADVLNITVVRVQLQATYGGAELGNGEAPLPPDTNVPENKKMSEGTFLLVNWDDDDGIGWGGSVANRASESVWAEPVSDLTRTTVEKENNLVTLKLSLWPRIPGTAGIDATSGAGRVRFWSLPGKTSQADTFWNLNEDIPDKIYMEGIEESSAVRDVTIEFTFVAADECANSYTDRVKATVVMINLGDAVYRMNQMPALGYKGHAALVTSFDAPYCAPDYLVDDTWFHVIEMGGSGAPHVIWSGLNTETCDSEYPCWGCYTIEPLPSYASRLKILRVAKFIYAWNTVYFTMNFIGPSSWVASQDKLAGVAALRCDGLVELAYEYNGLDVWGAPIPSPGGALKYGICTEGDIFSLVPDVNWAFYWVPGSNGLQDVLERHFGYDRHMQGCDWTSWVWPATQCGHVTPGCETDTKMIHEVLCRPFGSTGEANGY